MTIATLHRPLSLTLATLGLISLVACGGGGGGGGGGNSSSSAPVAVDTTPNAISFAATENAERNAQVTSPAVTISGINAATPISITGGEYSIAGGAFTSTAGTISNGQSLAVRLAASDKTNTAKTVTVTVGGVSATFSVTTFADTTADAFSFTAVTGAELNKEYTSEAITVSGIDVAVPVSVTGGLYSINGGEFTSAAGTVSASQTITLKATSGNNTDTTQNAVLSIGSISGTFAVTTIPDTTPPVAEFKFPTPYTMSEANSVKVRGTATDDHAITSVKVVVRSYNLATPTETISTTEIFATPKAEGDYSSWTAEVPLTALTENEIKVVAMDDRNNSTMMEVANKVAIRQAPIASAFPNELRQFAISAGLVIDRYAGRNQLLVSDINDPIIYSVSIETGEREVYKNYDDAGLEDFWGMVIDASKGEPMLYINELSRKKIIKADLASGDILNSYANEIYAEPRALVLDERDEGFSVITVNMGAFGRNSDVASLNLQTGQVSIISSDEHYPILPSAWGLTVDKKRDRYLVTVRNRQTNLYGIYSIDRKTGERKAFSTNEVGSGDLFVDGTYLQDIAIDDEKDILYAVDSTTGKLFSFDLNTGNRRVVSDLSYTNIDGVIVSGLTNIQISPEGQYAFVGDSGREALSVVDLMTGEKVFLSKSKNDF